MSAQQWLERAQLRLRLATLSSERLTERWNSILSENREFAEAAVSGNIETLKSLLDRGCVNKNHLLDEVLDITARSYMINNFPDTKIYIKILLRAGAEPYDWSGKSKISEVILSILKESLSEL